MTTPTITETVILQLQRDLAAAQSELAAMKQRAEAAEESLRFVTKANETLMRIDHENARKLAAAERKAEEAARDAERYRWLADTVLSCDYGDNNYPGKAIGWRVMPFFAPVAYGETIDAAIDAAIAAKGKP